MEPQASLKKGNQIQGLCGPGTRGQGRPWEGRTADLSVCHAAPLGCCSCGCSPLAGRPSSGCVQEGGEPWEGGWGRSGPWALSGRPHTLTLGHPARPADPTLPGQGPTSASEPLLLCKVGGPPSRRTWILAQVRPGLRGVLPSACPLPALCVKGLSPMCVRKPQTEKQYLQLGKGSFIPS